MLTVETWWYALSAISVINITLWVLSYRWLWRRKDIYPPSIFNRRLLMIWLSFVYVTVCAFRSFLPRIDLERIALLDHWLSSILIGRTVTTVAEIFFMAQCALLLHEAGKMTDKGLAVFLSLSLIPIIVIAEVFSWYAAITTNYLGSVVEESLWAFSGLLLVVGCLSLWPAADKQGRTFLFTATLFGIGFLVFMILVDVPMYWQRYVVDTVADKAYLPLWEGLRDMAGNYRQSFDWPVWAAEIPWMTLYFTVAVWVSIFLPHATIIRHKNNGHPSAISPQTPKAAKV
ncbi:MAG: hypothetical protein RRB22_02525 [Gammaproteobacteria bacterium]|nr:hypothetical protein [Gammaproteobacteria bacterium]